MSGITLHHTMNYTEGMEIEFLIRGVVHLQDEKEYFVLEDPARTKHFIEVHPFMSYRLRPGQTVTCRITKINCTGRIILEPNHPYYTIGESYNFKVINNSCALQEKFIIVEDVFNNPIEVTVPHHAPGSISEAGSLNCLIKDIRKGVPELLFLMK